MSSKDGHQETGFTQQSIARVSSVKSILQAGCGQFRLNHNSNNYYIIIIYIIIYYNYNYPGSTIVTYQLVGCYSKTQTCLSEIILPASALENLVQVCLNETHAAYFEESADMCMNVPTCRFPYGLHFPCAVSRCKVSNICICAIDVGS